MGYSAAFRLVAALPVFSVLGLSLPLAWAFFSSSFFLSSSFFFCSSVSRSVSFSSIFFRASGSPPSATQAASNLPSLSRSRG